MILRIFLSSVALVVSVMANSNGDLSYCDVNSPIGKGTSTMKWALAPKAVNVLNQKYSLRTSDGLDPSQDPTTYNSAQNVPIHIRTLDLDFKFIGLLMYATDPYNKKIGSWKVTPGTPYQITPKCAPFAVTHTDADIKPLHSVFYFVPPQNYTNSIFINVLIKQGEQNRGQFLVPTKLQLTYQSVDTPSYTTILAPAGSSCTTACSTQLKANVCDNAGTAAISNPESLWTSAVTANAVCGFPLVSGCSEAAPFFDTSSNLCVFKNTSCTTNYQATSCDSVSTSGQRLCVCSDGASPAAAGGLGSTTILAIGVGGAAFFILLVVLLFYFCFWRKRTVSAHDSAKSNTRSHAGSVSEDGLSANPLYSTQDKVVFQPR